VALGQRWEACPPRAILSGPSSRCRRKRSSSTAQSSAVKTQGPWYVGWEHRQTGPDALPPIACHRADATSPRPQQSGPCLHPAQVQRCGWTTVVRRKGPLIWAHVSETGKAVQPTTQSSSCPPRNSSRLSCRAGQAPAVLAVVTRCLHEYNEDVAVLLTAEDSSTYQQLGEVLPSRVVVQLAPFANELAIGAFLARWKPQVAIFMVRHLLGLGVAKPVCQPVRRSAPAHLRTPGFARAAG
jgi:hypothetical protein